MDRSVFNVTFMIRSVQTEDSKKLEQEVWRIRRMIDLMLDTCSDEAVFLHGGIGSSTERIE